MNMSSSAASASASGFSSRVGRYSPARRITAAVLFLALSPACDDEEQTRQVTDSNLTDRPTLSDLGTFQPVPGGGGCEGCVSCFNRLSPHVAEICIEANTQHVGGELGPGDDVLLASLLTTTMWHLYSEDGEPFCDAQGCTLTRIGPPDTDYYRFLVEIDHPNDQEPRRIAFGPALDVDDDSSKSSSIAIPSGVGLRPEGSIFDKAPSENPIAADDIEPIAHITFPAAQGGFGSCSGALVSDRHVLTAAHCFHRATFGRGVYGDKDHVDPQDLSVRIGGRDSPGGELFPDDALFAAISIEVHPQQELDLALVELAVPVAAAPLLRMTMPNLVELDPFEAYGYGVSRIPGDADASAYDWGRIKRMPLETTDDLPDELKEREHLLSLRRIDEQDIGPCRGDSGGPLIHRGGEQDVLVGVLLARAIFDPDVPLLAHASSDPGAVPRRAGLVIEPMSTRSFEFTRYNRCGIGGPSDPLRYIAVRLDRPKVRNWIDEVIGESPGGASTPLDEEIQ